jgi:hypothetical protein
VKAHAQQADEKAQSMQNLVDEIAKIKEAAKEKASLNSPNRADIRRKSTAWESVSPLRLKMSSSE